MKHLALCLLLAGCAADRPYLADPLPLACHSIPPGTMALVRIEEPVTCNGVPAEGCTNAQTVITVRPPRHPRDPDFAERLVHEFCRVTQGGWHP